MLYKTEVVSKQLHSSKQESNRIYANLKNEAGSLKFCCKQLQQDNSAIIQLQFSSVQ